MGGSLKRTGCWEVLEGSWGVLREVIEELRLPVLFLRGVLGGFGGVNEEDRFFAPFVEGSWGGLGMRNGSRSSCWGVLGGGSPCLLSLSLTLCALSLSLSLSLPLRIVFSLSLSLSLALPLSRPLSLLLGCQFLPPFATADSTQFEPGVLAGHNMTLWFALPLPYMAIWNRLAILIRSGPPCSQFV